ncbi:hypothetical protein [Sinomonas mesophila]|uniref:hypothetical protein n=1 Tax=Sinomonas mesophila TaxID=1531955 RepID=UPI00098675D7|nr:hypothetical protein [Sinomonas mesophila]
MTDLILPLDDVLSSVDSELLGWEEATAHIDEVAMAVTLHWRTSPSTRIHWNSDAWNEGLVQGGPGEADPSPKVTITDVSERWRDLSGKRLTACTFSHSTRPSDLPWAMNLQFASGANLVIALGELLDGQPSYMPDTLLVIGTREAAESYSHPAALGTAWGDRRE